MEKLIIALTLLSSISAFASNFDCETNDVVFSNEGQQFLRSMDLKYKAKLIKDLNALGLQVTEEDVVTSSKIASGYKTFHSVTTLEDGTRINDNTTFAKISVGKAYDNAQRQIGCSLSLYTYAGYPQNGDRTLNTDEIGMAIMLTSSAVIFKSVPAASRLLNSL